MWSFSGCIPFSISIILLCNMCSWKLAVWHNFTWWNHLNIKKKHRCVEAFFSFSFLLVATRCGWQLDRHGWRCQMDPDGHRLASTVARQGEGEEPVMQHVPPRVNSLTKVIRSESISVLNFLHIHQPSSLPWSGHYGAEASEELFSKNWKQLWRQCVEEKKERNFFC